MVRSALVLLALLAGCTTSPITGRDQYMVVSESQAVSQSAAAYSQMMADLGKKKKSRPARRAQKVKEITDKLVKEAVRVRPDASSWAWEVQVIDDPKTVNAFCMAGGKMAIYTGMWDQLKATDDEIAQVMGHEIAHALADHTRERMSIAMTTAVATTAAAIVSARATRARGRPRAHRGAARRGARDPAAEQPPGRIRGRPDRHRARRARGLRPESRGHAVGEDGQARRREGPPEFLSTHPSPENRAARLAELGAQVGRSKAAKAGKPTDAPKLITFPRK